MKKQKTRNLLKKIKKQKKEEKNKAIRKANKEKIKIENNNHLSHYKDRSYDMIIIKEITF